MIFQILILLVYLVVIFLSLLGIFLLISSRFSYSAPAVPTSGIIKQKILQNLSQQLKSKKSQTVIDLGSGWGTLLIPLARQFPEHQFIGVEHSYLPYWYCKLKSKKYPNLYFYCQDLFKFNLSKANVVVVFLIPTMLNRVYQKCLSELNSGTLLYSNRFPLPKIKPYKQVKQDSFNQFFIYKFK